MKPYTRFNAAIIGFFAALSTLAGAGSALAQSATSTIAMSTSPAVYRCQAPQSNAGFGAWDGGVSSGRVTTLQNFLAQQGYLTVTTRGYFGPLTFAAVKRFQADNGIIRTGFAGSLTRAAIAKVCGNPPISAAPIIRGLLPQSGTVGSTVSITGFGFSSSNTILMNGLVAVKNIPIESSIAVACTTDPSCIGGIRQTITFTIPSYLAPNCSSSDMLCAQYLVSLMPGTYKLAVQNENGTSNTLDFTITGGNSLNSLSISGLDAPSSLTIGQTGTWTVHAVAAQNTNLHYSVLWGDEASAGSSAIMMPAPTSVQTSATFTHVYQISGTYKSVFTVTDDAGHSASVTGSITVAPIY